MSETEELRSLPLHAQHVAAGARFAPFAGWNMPVRYTQIKDEHMTVRRQAGLFDVSHMGEVFVRGENAIAAVNALVTNDVSKLVDGQALYTIMCYPDGGCVDDLIVYRLSQREVLICVNAGNRAKDYQWIRDQIGDGVVVTDESDSFVQLALQGPRAVAVASKATDGATDRIAGFFCAWVSVAGSQVLAARTGYTGEDGFEFYIPVAHAARVCDALFVAGQDDGLGWIGLGARDSLRLEARLPLYGHEITAELNPLEAGLGWVVKFDKGDFIGRAALLAIREAGLRRRLRGLILDGKGMLREGFDVVVDGQTVGFTTSGSVAFALNEEAIALAYIDEPHCNRETVDVSIRGRLVPARLITRPFYRRS
jgi:aminomethyltransferase